MLIKRAVLDRIAAGEIDLVFRRQKRPTVRSGGTLRTAVGMLDIVEIRPVQLADLGDDDARRSGHGSVDELVAALTEKPEGAFYRVEVRPGAVDPRDALREAADLSDDDVAELRRKLDGMDERSPQPWTRQVLGIIAAKPNVRAPDLAAELGWETKPFKANVRKLKALGLTISHSPGYELSPRGQALLDRLHT